MQCYPDMGLAVSFLSNISVRNLAKPVFGVRSIGSTYGQSAL